MDIPRLYCPACPGAWPGSLPTRPASVRSARFATRSFRWKLGAVFRSLAFGYGVAATNPLRNVVWVQMGILRGTLELALGLVSFTRGLVTWAQARFGLAVAAVMVIAYVARYPRRSWFEAPAPSPN